MPADRCVATRGQRKPAFARVLALSLLLSLSGRPAAREEVASLEPAIAATLAGQGLTGAVWALVGPDGATRVAAAGVRDARSGEAMAPGDRVQVGSITKAVLATGILRLVSEGRLALDTSVTALLPDTAIDNPWSETDPVRVRHLLDHTSGLDDARMWQVFSRAPTAETPLARALAGDPALLRVRSRPGARFSYSNMGYGLLGRVIEAVTRERYEQFLDEQLLKPLGMRDSTFEFVTQEGPQADPRLALGHFEQGRAQAAIPVYLRPATQFTTTAADMARFARFLMGDGRIDGRAYIDPELLRAMGSPHGTDAALAGLRVGYGLGLSTRDRHGVVGRCHGGDGIGYVAMLCMFPQQQRAWFYSVNADSESADYELIDRQLIRALDIEAAAPEAPAATPVDPSAWAGWYVPAPNRFGQFAYLDTVFGAVRLRATAKELSFAPLQSPAVTLAPAGGALYRAPDRIWPSHVLLAPADAAREISRGTQSYRQVPLLELVPLWLSLAGGALGVLYLLLAGSTRALSRRLRITQPIFVPWLALLALVLPVPLFLRQSFLQLGDLTPASALLAASTAALPLAMAFGLYRHLRAKPRGAWARADMVAMLAVGQWTLVLAAWGLLPMRLWA
jgi:CubicO group peptidase (beta-lactamase class C family)